MAMIDLPHWPLFQDVRMIRTQVLNITANHSPHVDDTVTFNGRLDPTLSTWMKVIWWFSFCRVAFCMKYLSGVRKTGYLMYFQVQSLLCCLLREVHLGEKYYLYIFIIYICIYVYIFFDNVIFSCKKKKMR